MTRTSWTALKNQKVDTMTEEERVEYDRAYAGARLAAEVGQRIHDAREAAGLSQRELARRMGTSQAAIDRLESGGVGATITTLQWVATALGLEVSVELRPTA
jgi:ribosome-binding protein aMBF1 (putative translation factor)